MATRSASGLGNQVATWLTVLLATAVGPMTAVQIALLNKPLGGAVGLPGAVVGYIAVTAVTLGVVAVLPAIKLWRKGIGRVTGVIGVMAGGGLIAAGTTSSIGAFTGGLLVAGAVMMVLLVSGLRAAEGVRGSFAVLAAGPLAGALIAWGCFERPGIGLLTTGVATLALSIALTVCTWSVVAESGDHGVRQAARTGLRVLPAYAATGLAIGGTVLPALHLLLFRWSVLDADHPRYLVFAAAPMVVMALLPGRTGRALAPLLILQAGGALLIATAPGPWQLTVGVGLTLAAGVRCLSVADSSLNQQFSRDGGAARHAVTVLTAATGGLVGITLAVVLARCWGTGSALTLLAIAVLFAALRMVPAVPASARVHRPADSATTYATEGGLR